MINTDEHNHIYFGNRFKKRLLFNNLSSLKIDEFKNKNPEQQFSLVYII